MFYRQGIVSIGAYGLIVVASAVGVAQGKESAAKFRSHAKEVAIDLYEPDGSGTYPGVILLHAADGLNEPWKSQLEQFAQELTKVGMVVAVPHYFEVTATTPGVLVNVAQNRGIWLTAARDASAFLASQSNVKRDRIGLVGFGLGANLALDVAMTPPDTVTVRAVVDYFGPTVVLDGDIKKLPAVLIHHGLTDTIVDPLLTRTFVARLKQSGRVIGSDFEFHWYPDQNHRFTDSPTTALTDSRVRSISFLRAHLE
jgi:dienelactone hydrolase